MANDCVSSGQWLAKASHPLSLCTVVWIAKLIQCDPKARLQWPTAVFNRSFTPIARTEVSTTSESRLAMLLLGRRNIQSNNVCRVSVQTRAHTYRPSDEWLDTNEQSRRHRSHPSSRRHIHSFASAFHSMRASGMDVKSDLCDEMRA